MLNITGGTGNMHIQLCYKPQQVKNNNTKEKKKQERKKEK